MIINKLFYSIFGFLIILSLTLAVVSCKKESSSSGLDNGTNLGLGTASFTINGGGYTNKTYTFTNVPAYYIASENVTGISAGQLSGTDSVVFSIYFHGNQIGTFSWTDTTGASLYVYGLGGTDKYFHSFEGSGSTVVS